jgi:hypothetical protein
MAPATAGAVFLWSRLWRLRRLRVEPGRGNGNVKPDAESSGVALLYLR